MGFNSAFKGLTLLKTPGNGRLNNLNDLNRPQCVKELKIKPQAPSRLTLKMPTISPLLVFSFVIISYMIPGYCILILGSV